MKSGGQERTLLRSPGSKRKQPWPACICCGLDVPRSDEHIIPAGLGGGKVNNGELILRGATCEPCRARYHAAETKTIMRVFPGVAFHHDIRTRRKPENIVVKVVIDGELQERLTRSGMEPGIATTPIWQEPGIFRMADRETNRFGDVSPFYYAFAPGITERLTALGAEMFWAGAEYDAFDLAQFLAKVAHCYAVKELGFDWHPYALPVAMGWTAYAPYIIGTRPMKVDASRLHYICLSKRRFRRLTVYVVHVWFFTDPTDERELPVFEIVVGRPRKRKKPEYRSDPHSETSRQDHGTVLEPLMQGWPVPAPQDRDDPTQHIGFFRADTVEFLD